MKYTSGILLLLLVIYVFACNTEPSTPTGTNPDTTVTDLKTFYFPLEELKNGKIYAYINPQNDIIDHYAFYQTLEDEEGNIFLITTRYNGRFEQDMIIRDAVYSNGISREGYRFLVTDSISGKAAAYIANIEQSTTYPFDADTSLSYVYKMNYSIPPDLDMNIEYNRTFSFAGYTTEDVFNTSQEACVINSQEHFILSDSIQGGHFEMKAQAQEVYAKGFGLVYKERLTEQDSVPQIYRLHAIYTTEEFEKLALDAASEEYISIPNE